MPSRKSPDPRRVVLDNVMLAAQQAARVGTSLDGQTRENFRKKLNVEISVLQAASDRLDPVLRPTRLFNPLEPDTTARIVALMAASQPRHHLATLRSFYGAGVYALYYSGPFAPYAELSKKEHPVYVGKADPGNRSSNDPVEHGRKIFDRLREHRASIELSNNLDINDFDCRFLIVQSGFQQAAEAQLIEFFKPIWNRETKICYGIGKHGDSANTRKNKRSPWDTLHPGRGWADKTSQDQHERITIIEKIQNHLEQHPPISTLEELLGNFITELRQIDTESFVDASGQPQGIDDSDEEHLPDARGAHQETLLDLVDEA